MRDHVSIGYKEGFDQVADWLRQQPGVNPCLALGKGLHGTFWVVAAPTENLARWMQENLDRGTSVSPSMAVAEVIPAHNVVCFNKECSDASLAQLAVVIVRMLVEFPPDSVWDADRHEDITASVRANPRALFETPA